MEVFVSLSLLPIPGVVASGLDAVGDEDEDEDWHL